MAKPAFSSESRATRVSVCQARCQTHHIPQVCKAALRLHLRPLTNDKPGPPSKAGHGPAWWRISALGVGQWGAFRSTGAQAPPQTSGIIMRSKAARASAFFSILTRGTASDRGCCLLNCAPIMYLALHRLLEETVVFQKQALSCGNSQAALGTGAMMGVSSDGTLRAARG